MGEITLCPEGDPSGPLEHLIFHFSSHRESWGKIPQRSPLTPPNSSATLSERELYLFLDGQYHAARQGSDEREGVLSAYALLNAGRPVLLHLDLGPRESYDAWLSFLQDLTARGLSDPLLVAMDGAPGLVKAKRVWRHALRQRYQVHTMRNILAKLPRLMQAKMKLVQQVFLAPTYDLAIKRGRALIARFRDRYSAAMDCLEAASKSASRICAFRRRTIGGSGRPIAWSG
jgi:transposase-like protein